MSNPIQPDSLPNNGIFKCKRRLQSLEATFELNSTVEIALIYEYGKLSNELADTWMLVFFQYSIEVGGNLQSTAKKLLVLYLLEAWAINFRQELRFSREANANRLKMKCKRFNKSYQMSASDHFVEWNGRRTEIVSHMTVCSKNSSIFSFELHILL